MLQVGLHLTKNSDKYIELIDRLVKQIEFPREFNFIQLKSENDIIKHIHQAVDIPLIVGGGIRTPTAAAERVEAGAAIIVTGTVTERNSLLMKEFAKAIHWKIS